MAAHHLDEHQLAQLRQHALAAGALVRLIRPGEADELAEPRGIAARGASGLDDRRQVVEQRIERLGVAGEEAADQLHRGRPALADAAEERQRSGGGGVELGLRHRLGAHAGRARHDVRIALGEDDDLAFLEPHGLLAEHGRVAAAFGDHVIGDQVTGARQHLGQHHLTRRLLGNPRGRGDDVEERRAGEPYGLQNVR